MCNLRNILAGVLVKFKLAVMNYWQAILIVALCAAAIVYLLWVVIRLESV